MVSLLAKGWDINLKSLYGWWIWKRHVQLRTTEDVFEAPDADTCVVLYHIGEISLAGSVGHLAVFKNKNNPRCVFSAGRALCWHWGKDSVVWSLDGKKVFLYECRQEWGWSGPTAKLNTHLIALDLAQERWARWNPKPRYLFQVNHCEGDIITVSTGPSASDQRPEQIHLNRLPWKPFRRFWL